LSGFDFVISPGRSDANPTVLLEAMALGLIPICTRESGYDDTEHFFVVDYGDLKGVLNLLDKLQEMDSATLEVMRQKNFDFVRTFTWERFSNCVLEQLLLDLKSTTRPFPAEINPCFKVGEFVHSWNSPYRRWRGAKVSKLLENRLNYYLAFLRRKAV
jgi:hypothetical protein